MRKLVPVLLAVTLVAGSIHPAKCLAFSLQGFSETRFSSFATLLLRPTTDSQPDLRAIEDEAISRFELHELPGSDSGIAGRPAAGMHETRQICRARIAASPARVSSKLSFAPSFGDTDKLAVSGLFSIVSLGNEPGAFAPDTVSTSVFSGAPPFDRYYYGPPEPISRSLASGAWEQFWFTIAPGDRVRIWVGSGDLPAAVGPMLPQSGAKDIAALGIFGESWQMVMGTGAVAPSGRPNEDLSRPIPSGPLWLLGYTAVTTFYAGVATAIVVAVDWLCSPFSSAKKDDNDPKSSRDGQRPLFDSDKKDSHKEENPSLCRSLGWALLKAVFAPKKTDDRTCTREETKRTEKRNATITDRKGPALGLPYTIFDIGYDYSARMGDRKPFHFITLGTSQPYGSAGMGLLWYSHLDEIPRALPPEYDENLQEVPALPSPDADKAVDSALVTSFFGRYNDGRLFANARYSFFGWDVFPRDAPHRFHRGYHLFSEFGALVGPAKAALMFACSSGRPPRDSREGRRQIRYPIEHKLMEPYEFLMFHTYGGGNGTFEGRPGDRHGMMSDAYVFGGRVDVGMAANLNLWASCIWGHRMEPKGTLFGQYGPSGSEAGLQERRIFAAYAGRGMARSAPQFGYVSDGHLGYELNTGADWRLSDTVALKLQGGYWQPGAWFREAVAVRPALGSVFPAGLPTIAGLKCSLMVEF